MVCSNRWDFGIRYHLMNHLEMYLICREVVWSVLHYEVCHYSLWHRILPWYEAHLLSLLRYKCYHIHEFLRILYLVVNTNRKVCDRRDTSFCIFSPVSSILLDDSWSLDSNPELHEVRYIIYTNSESGIEVFVEELVCYIKRTKMFECECKWLPVSWNNIQYVIVWKVEMEFTQHILYLYWGIYICLKICIHRVSIRLLICVGVEGGINYLLSDRKSVV